MPTLWRKSPLFWDLPVGFTSGNASVQIVKVNVDVIHLEPYFPNKIASISSHGRRVIGEAAVFFLSHSLPFLFFLPVCVCEIVSTGSRVWIISAGAISLPLGLWTDLGHQPCTLRNLKKSIFHCSRVFTLSQAHRFKPSAPNSRKK